MNIILESCNLLELTYDFQQCKKIHRYDKKTII